MRVIKLTMGIASVMLLTLACNNVDFKKTRGGIAYKVFPGKGGDKIEQGNIVKFHVIQKIGDSVKFNSYDQIPQYMQVQTAASPQPSYDIAENLMEVLPTVKAGDSLYFVQSVDTFMAKRPELASDTTLKKGQNIITTVRILGVFKTQELAQGDRDKEMMTRFMSEPKVKQQIQADQKIIEDYLAKNNIKAKKTEMGNYVEVQNPGQGAAPASGKFAHIRYRGMNLQGTEFDSNMDGKKPVYPLQIGMGGSIKGFEDGVMQLRKGGKGRVFIPSMFGYGPMGSPPAIQPNEILMFEIEVEDVTDQAPAQEQRPGTIDTTGGGR